MKIKTNNRPLDQAIQHYHRAVDKLTGRKADSGQLFENLIRDVVHSIPKLCWSVGDDDQFQAKIGDHVSPNVQVDAHIRCEETEELVACVESKTYIDLSMLKRALMDFAIIAECEQCTKDTKFIIFAGQKTISEVNLNFWRAWFEKQTGRTFHLFVVNEHKNRSSYSRIDKKKFSLDRPELRRFRNLLTPQKNLPHWLVESKKQLSLF